MTPVFEEIRFVSGQSRATTLNNPHIDMTFGDHANKRLLCVFYRNEPCVPVNAKTDSILLIHVPRYI